MSITKSVGRCTLFALIVYLFVKGALIVVPRNMVAAISALVAALVHACCGTGGSVSMQESEVAVFAMAPAPIHDQQQGVKEGKQARFSEDHRGVEHAPPQDQSFE